MKKMTRTLIAVITVLIMVLTSSVVFSADKSAEDAGFKSSIDAVDGDHSTVSDKTLQTDQKLFQASPIQEKGYSAKSTGYLNAKTLAYASTKKPEAKALYFDGAGDFECWSIGVKTTGKLYVDAGSYSDNEGPVTVVVGTFSNGKIHYYKGADRQISPGDSKSAIGGYDVKPGKRYWIGIKSSSPGALAVRAYAVSYKTRLLKGGKMMVASGVRGASNKDAAVKFRIRPKKSGCITVKLKEYGKNKSEGYVRLLNKKKKIVSDRLTFRENSKTKYVVFGVKKGVTYYLKVTGCQGTADNCRAYVIKYSLKKSPVRKNTKKKKAIKLKRKGSYKNTVLLGNGKKGSQWYKFRVTKKRKTVVMVDTTRVKSGKVRLIIYAGKQKIGSTTVSNGRGHEYTVTHSTTWGKANKGTYYIKISKSKKATGQYRIKYSR